MNDVVKGNQQLNHWTDANRGPMYFANYDSILWSDDGSRYEASIIWLNEQSEWSMRCDSTKKPLKVQMGLVF